MVTARKREGKRGREEERDSVREGEGDIHKESGCYRRRRVRHHQIQAECDLRATDSRGGACICVCVCVCVCVCARARACVKTG